MIVRGDNQADSMQLLDLVRELQRFELQSHDRMMPVEDIGTWYVEALQARCPAEAGTGEIDEVSYLYGEISHITVHPAARGAGIGKRLMSECESMAASARRKWLRINVFANNPAARGLYEKLGFYDHLIVMEKPLD